MYTASMGMVFICLTAASAGPTTSPVEPRGGFVLTILSPAKWLAAGDRLRLQVGITNATNKALKFCEVDGADDFDVSVFVDDKPAARTEFGKNLLRRASPVIIVSEWFPKVEPAETRWYSVDITRRFDMTMPGVYTIRISRRVPKLDSPLAAELELQSATARADDVRIEVLPPKYSGGSTTQPAQEK